MSYLTMHVKETEDLALFYKRQLEVSGHRNVHIVPKYDKKTKTQLFHVVVTLRSELITRVRKMRDAPSDAALKKITEEEV